MPTRPSQIPRFATDPGADIAEPATGTLDAGFVPNDRPPAQWFNWIFNRLGAWIDFARGPNASNWLRTDDTASYNIVDIHSDEVTVQSGVPLYRIVSVEDSGTAQVIKSVRGDAFETSAVNSTITVGAPNAILFDGAIWILASTNAGAGKLVWTWPDGSLSGTSAITTPATNWGVSTPGGTVNPSVALALEPGVTVAYATTNKVYVSTSAPVATTYNAVTFSAAPSGNFTDVLFTGSKWLAIDDAGEIYQAASGGAGTWTLVQTIAAGVYRLVSDGAGTVLAYVKDSAGTPNWYSSTDHGGTWAISTTPAFKHIQRIRFLDSQYFLAATAFPILACANTIDSTAWLMLPHPISTGNSSALNDLCFSQGALVAGGVAHNLVSVRAQDVSPYPYVPSPEPGLRLTNIRASSKDNSATPGNNTANTASGRCAVAIGASSVVVTNDLVTADSHVEAYLSGSADDATLTRIKRVHAATGSFTVVCDANATAATQIDWIVVGT